MNPEEIFALLRRADPARGDGIVWIPSPERTPRGRWIKAGVVLAAAAVFTILAFGPLGMLGGNPPVTDSVPTVVAPPEESSIPTETTAMPADTSTIAPAGDGAGLLLADGSSVIDLGSGEVVVDAPAVVAYDDLRGGVVFQAGSSALFGDTTGTDVWHQRAGATGPEPLMEQNGDATLRLMGVFEVEGTPTVVVVERRNPGDVEGAVEVMYEIAVDTGAIREVGIVGGWERGPAAISWDGSSYVLSTFAEGYTSLRILDRQGAQTPWSGALAGECFDEPTCPRVTTATPDGRFLLYSRGDLIDRNEIVLWSRIADAEVWSVAWDGGPILGPISVDGNTVVVNHYHAEDDAAPGVGTASLLTLDSGQLSEVELPGFVDAVSPTGGVGVDRPVSSQDIQVPGGMDDDEVAVTVDGERWGATGCIENDAVQITLEDRSFSLRVIDRSGPNPGVVVDRVGADPGIEVPAQRVPVIGGSAFLAGFDTPSVTGRVVVIVGDALASCG